jgi:hypothetical protein
MPGLQIAADADGTAARSDRLLVQGQYCTGLYFRMVQP